jgi:hypothetical protein
VSLLILEALALRLDERLRHPLPVGHVARAVPEVELIEIAGELCLGDVVVNAVDASLQVADAQRDSARGGAPTLAKNPSTVFVCTSPRTYSPLEW